MSRFRSLSTLSLAVVVTAGLVAIGGLTPDAAAKPAGTTDVGGYQATLRHGGGVETIEVLGWTHQIDNSATFASGGGAGAGKRTYKPLLIRKRVDKASPILMKACADGKHFPEVVLTATRSTKGQPQTYLTITLENVLISSFQTSGEGSDTGDTQEVENVSMVFGKIKFNYMDHGVTFEDDVVGGS
jgi:type VI secretion system secreted protein Hcp